MSYSSTHDLAIVTSAKQKLRALNHPLRQKMLALIEENGSMIVTDIYQKLRIEQSVASQQLAIMRNENLVITKREGKKIYYGVNKLAIKKLIADSQQLIAD